VGKDRESHTGHTGQMSHSNLKVLIDYPLIVTLFSSLRFCGTQRQKKYRNRGEQEKIHAGGRKVRLTERAGVYYNSIMVHIYGQSISFIQHLVMIEVEKSDLYDPSVFSDLLPYSS